jgi:hypothetical protein
MDTANLITILEKPMPQDLPNQQSVSAIPYEASDEYQNLFRTPPVDFASGHGLSQHFRGTVSTNSTATLHTNAVSLNSYTMNLLRGGTSVLTIYAGKNPSGTGMNLGHNEKVGAPKPGMGAGRKAFDVVKKLNRIRSIIQAPIDQALEMEVFFGDYNGGNSWKGMYASGATYRITSKGVAVVAMIKLTCHNPVNPGWFSFSTSIAIQPAAPPPKAAAPQRPGVLDQIGEGFGQMLRNIQSGRNPW